MSDSEQDYEEEQGYEDYEEESNFVADVKAFERTQKGAAFYQLPEDKQFRSHRKGLSDDELFLMSLEFAYLRYRDLLLLSETTIQNIKAMVYRMTHVKFKNAGAFLWGYYILEEGKTLRINKDKIDEAYRLLNPRYEKENSIKKEDMVRYARLIINHKE